MSNKDEAAFQFALRLQREGRLPRIRGKKSMGEYRAQMAALREEFEKEQRDAGKTNL